VSGSVVVDLCCGSGGLGLEALSRGAEYAYFVDVARASMTSAKVNLEQCGANSTEYSLEQTDSLDWMMDWDGASGSPWILICDPPYQSPIAATMMSLVSQGRHPDGLICAVIEYGPRTPGMPTEQPGWQLRRYGESHLAIFRPGADSPSQEI
jgi:16S rRNA (guanine966-N2)-methyltransferase